MKRGCWVYGQVCKVRAICPQASGQKGADVRSGGAGAKKDNCGFLMLVSSRDTFCLATGRGQSHQGHASPSSKKAFSMRWCLDAMSVTPGDLVSRIARRAVASCFRKESGDGGVGIPQPFDVGSVFAEGFEEAGTFIFSSPGICLT